MNEKEAREAVANFRSDMPNISFVKPGEVSESFYFGAKGYLEAIEKAKGIHRLLREIADNPDRMLDENFSDEVEEELAQWEEEK